MNLQGLNQPEFVAELTAAITGEVRFDPLSQALYSTDASVYQIRPLGVILPRAKGDLLRIVDICRRHKVPITMRGGGTAQAGQSIGEGVIVDISKYYNQILEFDAENRWVRVQPGIVLDELNSFLKPHGLRFAPDVSTASRATIGGMMANNSSGARSVWYGKTLDHVIEQEVVLSDGSIAQFRPRLRAEVPTDETTLEARCYRTVLGLAATHAAEIDRRYPKILRRVGGYNLDEFIDPSKPVNLAKMMVGSEGTLGVVLEAKLNLVPLPKAKAVLAVQFHTLSEALGATPRILTHRPSAVEVMDRFILDHTRLSPALQRLRETFVEGSPGALLCIEFYDETDSALPPRLDALEQELRDNGFGYRCYKAYAAADQARIWSLREAALGLSMTMKEDAKSLSFVEDTAVAPDRLRDYIERFMAIVAKHETSAGVYAHASVGCLHVRPVVNMKTAEGVAKFESIANEVCDLVLEFGGALSGEHGDGYVRSPFMERMFGPELYQAFREIKRTFDPEGLFNPGKIVDSPPLTRNLRYGAGYVSPSPRTFFDYAEFGGFGGAVEMCSGLGACRKTMDGTMCPSFMATRDERDVTRGRANVLRLAMNGKLDGGLDDEAVHDALDLCLECRACKTECPVGVDMARFKSEFLSGWNETRGMPLDAKLLGNIHAIASLGSRFAPLMNALTASAPMRAMNEALIGIDSRRKLPKLAPKTLAATFGPSVSDADVYLFNDTFTGYYDPQIGLAIQAVLEGAGKRVSLAPNHCCGRPLISKGLLKQARAQAALNVSALHSIAASGRKIVFAEPSCLSAVKEDAQSLLRGEAAEKARTLAAACVLFEEYAAGLPLNLKPGPTRVLLHGHCHQKSMALVQPAKTLLSKIPGAEVIDLDAGCCGMAGSFGYSRDHYDVSRRIGEHRLLPQIRAAGPNDAVVAAGTSCRHQIADFTTREAVHPAILLRDLLA